MRCWRPVRSPARSCAPEAALARRGPLGAPEVAALCDLPATRARVELWRLAAELRARPRDVAGGELWELA